MKQVIEQLLQQAISQLKQENLIPHAMPVEIQIERPKETVAHGDFTTNLALIMAKQAKLSPRVLAARLVDALPRHDSILKIDIAGPGFINFFLKPDILWSVIPMILKQGAAFGAHCVETPQKIILEFVSSNPTGPLHVGHGRSAAFGATLANLLTVAGHEVCREYYVNDAGRQMSILAASVWLRYLALAGEPIVFPANAYKGDYVEAIAATILADKGRIYVHPFDEITKDLPPDEPEGGDKEQYIDALVLTMQQLLTKEGYAVFHQYALQTVLADIRDDLKAFGVTFDHWFSEQTLWDNGAIEKSISALKQAGYTYEEKGALWFKATVFGDEKDRVLLRANGQPTYFAADVAYHWDKYDRGFDKVINIFGADHHGYVTRIQSAVKALGHDETALTVLLVQFAILYRQGERVQMSTRSGSFVTLRALREEVGNDAARFFYVMRKPEQHMDFDLDLAKSESSDNPVYYIQYAHARICSVMRQLKERGLTWETTVEAQDFALLQTPQEKELMVLLNRYPDVILVASKQYEPHQLAYYLRELAQALHSYYNAVPLLCESQPLREARLYLALAVGQVLKNGLDILGVTALESM